MSNTPPRPAPTPEECNDRAIVPLAEGIEGMAFWWPQMGGYASKAVIYQAPEEKEAEVGCFSVLVWHDGCFPFDGQCPNCSSPREPVQLHLCSAEQWLQMATMFARFAGISAGGTEE